MLVASFMRFRRKRLEKQTHIDNFLYLLYIFFIFEKKFGSISKKKIEKNFENNLCKFFIFEKKSVKSWLKFG